MEIKIDQDMIQSAIDKQLSSLVERAVTEYSVSSAIREAVATAISNDLIRVAAVEAVAQIDRDALRNAIADQMARTMVKGVSLVVESAVVEMLIRLENQGYLTDAARAAKAADVHARLHAARRG